MVAANKTFLYQSKQSAPYFSYQWYLEKAEKEMGYDPVENLMVKAEEG